MSEFSKRFKIPWPVETEKAKEIWKYLKNLATVVDEINQGHADFIQSGVVSESDWKITAEIVGGTGEIKSSTNVGGTAWSPDPTLGTTVLMRSSTPVKKIELLPSSLPSSGQYMVIGIELTAETWNAEAKITLVSGVAGATEAEAFEKVPAVTSGKIRLRDVMIKNTTGTYSIVTQWDRREQAESTHQPGDLKPTARSTAPFGWLFCSGQSVKRAQYPALFAAIGTTYGSLSSTTFTLPGGEGRVFMGEGNSFTEGSSFHGRGTVGGADKVKLTLAQLAAHSHTMEISDVGHFHLPSSGHKYAEWDETFGSGANLIYNLSMSGPETASWTNIPTGVPYARGGTETGHANMSWFMYNAGSGETHANLQPYFVGNYLIKY